MNDDTSQFSIVNDKKGHNIMNDSFAHKPDSLLVDYIDQESIIVVYKKDLVLFSSSCFIT